MKATDQQRNLITVKQRIEEVAETPESHKDQTAIGFIAGGAYPTGVSYGTYHVRFFDCELDQIEGVVTFIHTDHYEVCTLYLGAQITTLWSEGSAVSVD